MEQFGTVVKPYYETNFSNRQEHRGYYVTNEDGREVVVYFDQIYTY
jgi:hypothetical protein